MAGIGLVFLLDALLSMAFAVTHREYWSSWFLSCNTDIISAVMNNNNNEYKIEAYGWPWGINNCFPDINKKLCFILLLIELTAVNRLSTAMQLCFLFAYALLRYILGHEISGKTKTAQYKHCMEKK